MKFKKMKSVSVSTCCPEEGYLYRMNRGEACVFLWGSAPWGGGGGGHSRRPLPLAPPLVGLGFRQPMLGSPIADHL